MVVMAAIAIAIAGGAVAWIVARRVIEPRGG